MKLQGIKFKLFALCGILSPLVYIVAVALGGILDPSYSHVTKTVSELVQLGAPNRELLNALFVVYNVLIIPFGVGLYCAIGKGRLRNVVSAALILTGLLGVVVTLFFPLDAGGQSVTFTGMMHLVVVGMVVPCTFAFELGFWQIARKDSLWRILDKFSLALFVITLISGVATAAFVSSNFRGLLERITIGSTLLWIEVIAMKLISISKKNSNAQ